MDIADRAPEEHRNMVDSMIPKKGASSEEGVACVYALKQYLEKNNDTCFPENSVAPCLVHAGHLRPIVLVIAQADHEFEGLPQPLTLHVAGAMCTPWSAMGSRKGLADPATKAWHIWSVERTQRLEDIISLEEAD